MRNVFILLIFSAIMASCQSNTRTEKAAPTSSPVVATAALELDVEGMTCTGCEASIQAAVGELEGVGEVKADHVAKKTTVTYDSTKTNPAAIIAVIRETGYTVLE